MTRRELLRLLLAAPIAATLDVEKLLWTPGQMVTVPAMPAWFRVHDSVIFEGDMIDFENYVRGLTPEDFTRLEENWVRPLTGYVRGRWNS